MPAYRMEVVGKPKDIQPVQKEVQAEIDEAEGKPWPMGSIERFAFYEHAKKAYCVITDRRDARSTAASSSRRASSRRRNSRMAAQEGVAILGIFVADLAFRAGRHAEDRRDHRRLGLQDGAGRQGLEPVGRRGAASAPR